MWQNSRHSSRSAWVQNLKDKMEKPVLEPGMMSDVDVNAETEDGSTDGIPDDFMGVVDTPAFDGSEPPLSQPDPQLDDKVGGQLGKQV